MKPTRCANCGSTEKVEHDYQIGGVLIRDPYCGMCGANWGVVLKPKPKPKHEQSEAGR